MKYKIGWCNHGKWKYIVVNTHAEMLAEVADKTALSDKISIRIIR